MTTKDWLVAWLIAMGAATIGNTFDGLRQDREIKQLREELDNLHDYNNLADCGLKCWRECCDD